MISFFILLPAKHEGVISESAAVSAAEEFAHRHVEVVKCLAALGVKPGRGS